MMTNQQIRERLHEIARLAVTDAEAATVEERQLHGDVLRVIADDVDGALSVSIVRHFAWLALSSKGIEFDRHAA